MPSIESVAAIVYAIWKKQPASVTIWSDLAAKASIPYWCRAVSDTEYEALIRNSQRAT